MPAINIRKELYNRAIRAKIDKDDKWIVEVANDAIEKYLDEHDKER